MLFRWPLCFGLRCGCNAIEIKSIKAIPIAMNKTYFETLWTQVFERCTRFLHGWPKSGQSA